MFCINQGILKGFMKFNSLRYLLPSVCMLTSCGGISYFLLLMSIFSYVSTQGMIKNTPGPLAPPEIKNFLFWVSLHIWIEIQSLKRYMKPVSFTHLTLYLMGYKLRQFWWGGALNAPPLKTLKMKLQSHVRGQNRGSWVCPVHLDYFQLADMCISRVSTWF